MSETRAGTDRYVPFGTSGPGGRVSFWWDVAQVPGAAGVLWQVGRAGFSPFAGGADQDLEPHGRVASGVGSGPRGVFEIDVTALARSQGLSGAPRTFARASRTMDLRYPFRVRVIPVGPGRQHRAAAQEAARQAKNVTVTEDKTCEWRDMPSRLTVAVNNDDGDLVDVRISAGTVWDLYPMVDETMPLLKRGERMAIPIVLRPSLSRRYFDGQLYRGGTLWFDALHTQKTEFRIVVTGTLLRPDGPYTRIRREFTTPSRVWDHDQTITF